MLLPSSFEDEGAYVQQLVDFVGSQPFINLQNLHFLDTFIPEDKDQYRLNPWNELVPEWKEWFEKEDEEAVVSFLLGKTVAGLEVPLSLIAYIDRVKSLELPRQSPDVVGPPDDKFSFNSSVKKSHEVEKFVDVIDKKMVRQLGITHVVDVGAGFGYLSRTLVSQLDLKVLAIDSDPNQISGSNRLGSSDKNPSNITYLCKRVEPGDQMEEVDIWLAEERKVLGKEAVRCCIVGLHACGSLTESILRMYASKPDILSCAVAGCCYNHIITLKEGNQYGFPLSVTFRDNDVSLSGISRMAACQNLSRWATSPVENGMSENSRRHLYRSLLSLYLFNHHSDILNPPVGAIPRSSLSSLSAYFVACLSKLNLHEDPAKIEAEGKTMESEFVPLAKRVRILRLLALSSSGVVESLIAMDRYLFVKEEGEKGDVLVGWDYQASPRNLILMGHKI